MAHTISCDWFKLVRLHGEPIGEPDFFAIRAGRLCTSAALSFLFDAPHRIAKHALLRHKLTSVKRFHLVGKGSSRLLKDGDAAARWLKHLCVHRP